MFCLETNKPYCPLCMKYSQIFMSFWTLAVHTTENKQFTECVLCSEPHIHTHTHIQTHAYTHTHIHPHTHKFTYIYTYAPWETVDDKVFSN